MTVPLKIVVTTVADCGPGSLRDAVAMATPDGPTTISIEASGYLDLKTPLVIGGFTGKDAVKNLTIHADHSTHGVIIRDNGLVIERNNENVTLRNLQLMTGDKALSVGVIPNKSNVPDPLTIVGVTNSERGWKPASGIRIENCVLMWGGDLNCLCSGTDVTFYRTLFAECLAHPNHPKGRHSKNLLLSSHDVPDSLNQIKIIECAFAGSHDRSPHSAGSELFMANSVCASAARDTTFGTRINSWALQVMDHGPYDKETDTFGPNERYRPNNIVAVNNHFFGIGPMAIYLAVGTEQGQIEGRQATTIAFGQGNQINGDWLLSKSQYMNRIRYTVPNVPMPDSVLVDLPWWAENYPYVAFESIIANVGSYQPNTQTDRIKQSLLSRELLPLITNQDDVGGWPVISSEQN